MVERTLISFPSQLQLIERLQHLLYLSSSMVFISGEKGCGKSTLIEQLSNQLPPKTQQAFITLVEPVSAAQIRLQIISQLFEQPLFDADDRIFNSFLLLKGKLPADVARVVVIDNADLLPEQLVNELAEVINKKSLLSDNEINFILLGEPVKNNQMVTLIKQSSGNQGVAALSFKLPPLTASEAQQLLKHSLDQVSYLPKIQHQDALVKQLANCQGIPAKILLLATEISSGKVDDDKASWLKTKFPAIFLMFLLVVIATGLAFYLYPQFIKTPVEIDTIIETEAVLLDEIVSIDVIGAEETFTEALAGNWSKATQVLSDNQLSVGEADTEARVIISELHFTEVAQSGSISTIDNNSHVPIITLEQKVITTPSAVMLENDTLDAEETSINDVAETEPSLESDSENVQPVVELDTVQQQENIMPEVIEQQIVPEADGDTLFTSTELLLAINPNQYTLQLAALGSKKSLQAFMETYQLPQKDVYIYQTMRNGKELFVVIYGQFDSRELAIQDAGNRPNTLKKLDSWAKKYALVHQDLQLNEQ